MKPVRGWTVVNSAFFPIFGLVQLSHEWISYHKRPTQPKNGLPRMLPELNYTRTICNTVKEKQ